MRQRSSRVVRSEFISLRCRAGNESAFARSVSILSVSILLSGAFAPMRVYGQTSPPAASTPPVAGSQVAAPAVTPQNPETPTERPPIDLILGKDATVIGRILDGHGHPVVGIAVTISFEGRLIAAVQTDGSGQFKISGIRPGLHRVTSGPVNYPCRLLAEDTKDEKAFRDLILMIEPPVQPGDDTLSSLKNLTDDLRYRAGSKIPDVTVLADELPELKLPTIEPPPVKQFGQGLLLMNPFASMKAKP